MIVARYLCVNDFAFEGAKARFYIVSNHRARFVACLAWPPPREAKYVIVIEGSAIVCAVPIDDWDAPNRFAEIDRYILSAVQPAILFIPPGYANGFMSLTERSETLVSLHSYARRKPQ